MCPADPLHVCTVLLSLHPKRVPRRAFKAPRGLSAGRYVVKLKAERIKVYLPSMIQTVLPPSHIHSLPATGAQIETLRRLRALSQRGSKSRFQVRSSVAVPGCEVIIFSAFPSTPPTPLVATSPLHPRPYLTPQPGGRRNDFDATNLTHSRPRPRRVGSQGSFQPRYRH